MHAFPGRFFQNHFFAQALLPLIALLVEDASLFTLFYITKLPISVGIV